MTKVYKLEVMVIDFEGHGLNNAIIDIEDQTYCNASVINAETAEIGEWDDSHPLNNSETQREAFAKLFSRD